MKQYPRILGELVRIITGSVGVGVGVFLVFVALNALDIVSIPSWVVAVFAMGFLLVYRFMLWALNGEKPKDTEPKEAAILPTAKPEPITLTLLSEDGKRGYYQTTKKITPRDLVILADGIINQDKSLGFTDWTGHADAIFTRSRFQQIRDEGIRLNWWQPKSNKSNYAGLELTTLGRTVLTHYAALARKALMLRRAKQASKVASLKYLREL